MSNYLLTLDQAARMESYGLTQSIFSDATYVRVAPVMFEGTRYELVCVQLSEWTHLDTDPPKWRLVVGSQHVYTSAELDEVLVWGRLEGLL